MEHSFVIEVANEHGIEAAILIRHLQFWITKNQADGKHQHDDRTWTYSSVKALQEIFPYMTAKKVRWNIDKLVERGILLKGKYSKKKNDQTTWYAFQDEKTFITAPESICPQRQMFKGNR